MRRKRAATSAFSSFGWPLHLHASRSSGASRASSGALPGLEWGQRVRVQVARAGRGADEVFPKSSRAVMGRQKQ
jgi:hypothetical protein